MRPLVFGISVCVFEPYCVATDVYTCSIFTSSECVCMKLCCVCVGGLCIIACAFSDSLCVCV